MSDERNQQNTERNTQATQQSNEETKTSTSEQNKPDDRLKDGTNDFQNGDQEPMSERPQEPQDREG
jgi:hypothetical protein